MTAFIPHLKDNKLPLGKVFEWRPLQEAAIQRLLQLRIDAANGIELPPSQLGHAPSDIEWMVLEQALYAPVAEQRGALAPFAAAWPELMIDAEKPNSVHLELPAAFHKFEGGVKRFERAVNHLTETLSVDEIIHKARKKTGLKRFPDEAFLRRMLQWRMPSELDNDTRFMGRTDMFKTSVQDCITQLQLQAVLEDSTHILHHFEVRDPIWIIGLPRSGTTKLFHLLSLDDTADSLPYWMLASGTLPPPKSNPRNDRRRRATRLKLSMAPLADSLQKVHQFDADYPEEDDLLLTHCGVNINALPCVFDTEAYYRAVDNLSSAELSNAYHHHALLLKAGCLNRQPEGEPKHWIFKSTVHARYIKHLAANFPNARFVQTHRDPLKAVASMASLRHNVATMMYTHDQPHRLGRRVSRFQASAMESAMTYRDSLSREEEAKRFLDVQFKDVCEDPIGVVRQIYEQFGMRYTKTYEARMQKYLDEEAKSGGGSKHSYTPEQYGLSEEIIDKQFGEYQRRYLGDGVRAARQSHDSGHATE